MVKPKVKLLKRRYIIYHVRSREISQSTVLLDRYWHNKILHSETLHGIFFINDDRHKVQEYLDIFNPHNKL